MFNLIIGIGNIAGAKKPNDPNPEWVVASAVTKAQVWECGNSKPLTVKEMASKMAVYKEELVRLQKKRFFAAKILRERNRERDTEFLMKNVEKFGTQQKNEVGDTRKQILVSKLLKNSFVHIKTQN